MAAKTKFHLNLYWRLPILVGLMVTITAAVLIWLLVNLERRTFTHEFQTSLLHQGRAIARTLSSSAFRDNPDEGIIRTLVSAKEDNPYLNGAYFFSEGGEIYSADEEIVPLGVEGERVVLDSLRVKEELRAGEDFFYLSLPVLIPASTPGEFTTLGELRLVLSVEPVRQALEKSTRRGVFTGVTAMVLITGLSLLVFLHALRPLKELRRGAKQLEAGNLSYRIKVKAKNEFGQLATTFNEMAERLENLHEAPSQKERISRDLEIARQLQRSYLPEEPPIYHGISIAGFCEPAYEVGGDYYDFIPIDDRRLGVLVADVSGKSLQGLMIMLMLRTIMRSTVPRHFDARPTICETNTILNADMQAGNFVTCVYYVYDSRNQSLDVVNAGHNPLLIHHYYENEVETVKPRGRPLGLIDPEEFYRTLESTIIKLDPGDTVLIYTDGVTESMNDRMELYGEKRLKEAFTMFAELKPRELVKKLAETAHAFTGNAKQFDDMTLVALQVDRPDTEKTPMIDLAEELNSTVDRYLSESGV